MSSKHTPLAIIYDFDGTLAPGNMQEPQFIPEIGMRPSDFWEQVNILAKKHKADKILMYMHLMLKKANEKGVKVHLDNFHKRGREIPLFDGVEEWFPRITRYGRSQRIKVEHYIVSSGNAEIMEGTRIAKYFRAIFGSRFMFDQHGVAMWPAQALNYTTKTQFLFRINKDALEVTDDKLVNEFVPMEDRRVPFENMIYIGDGDTDVPCFRLVKDHEGLSLAVFAPRKTGGRDKATTFFEQGRVNGVAPADYSEGRELDKIVKAQIDLVVAREMRDKLRQKAA